jgi:hypothetical protein
MALMTCEYCGERFTKKPAQVNKTKYKRVCCRNPMCFRKLLSEVALKTHSEKREGEIAK